MWKYCISIEWDHLFLTELFLIPDEFALSQWVGIGVCGWPSSCKVMQNIRSSFSFMKISPNSSSIAYDDTILRMVQRVNKAPLRQKGEFSFGVCPRNKCPDDQLFAPLAER